MIHSLIRRVRRQSFRTLRFEVLDTRCMFAVDGIMLSQMEGSVEKVDQEFFDTTFLTTHQPYANNDANLLMFQQVFGSFLLQQTLSAASTSDLAFSAAAFPVSVISTTGYTPYVSYSNNHLLFIDNGSDEDTVRLKVGLFSDDINSGAIDYQWSVDSNQSNVLANGDELSFSRDSTIVNTIRVQASVDDAGSETLFASAMLVLGSTHSDVLTVDQQVDGNIALTVTTNGQTSFRLFQDEAVLIFGNAGNDSINVTIGAGVNGRIEAGEGDDVVRGSKGKLSIFGGNGNDLIYGGDEGDDDTMYGGGGDDTIYGGQHNDLIFGGSGDGYIVLGEGRQQAFGGDGNDLIYGGDEGEDDTLYGGGGNDTIYGGEHNDLIFGGSGDDVLVAGSGNQTIYGESGNDLIFGGDDPDDTIDGGSGSDTIIGGNGNDLIFGGEGDDYFMPSNGMQTISGGGGHDVIVAEVPLDGYVFQNHLEITGKGNISFEDVELIEMRGSNANNLIDATLSTARVRLIGNSGNDLLIGGPNDDELMGGAGNDTMVGSHGNDIYAYDTNDSGEDIVDEFNTNGADGFDFSRFGRSVFIDLANGNSQEVALDTRIQILGDLEIVYGSEFPDEIFGNNLSNRLYGLGGADYLVGGAGHDTLAAGLTKVVYLDFDSMTEEGERTYSQVIRDAIQSRIEADYESFDVKITQTLPTDRHYIRVYFNAAVHLPGSSIMLGGISERIGWRELGGSGRVLVDVNGFLGNGSSQRPDTDDNFIALSSTIASHELGHMYGLRHHDAFGSPGNGVYDARNLANRFLPVYPGPKNAIESSHHLMASPASIGTTLTHAAENPFFGEREAMKLAFAESGVTIPESSLANKSLTPVVVDGSNVPAQHLGELVHLVVPNTVETGVNTFNFITAAALNVIGDIELNPSGTSESDFYTFVGRAGDLISIELMSSALRHKLENTIDSILRMYNSAGQKISHFASALGAFNDDIFESTDSLVLDIVLPADDIYTIEVDTFSFSTPEFPIYHPDFDVAAFIAAYPENIYVQDRDTGSYELYIHRFGGNNYATSYKDVLIGGDGVDHLVGNSSIEVIVGYDSTDDFLINPFGVPQFVQSVADLSIPAPVRVLSVKHHSSSTSQWIIQDNGQINFDNSNDLWTGLKQEDFPRISTFKEPQTFHTIEEVPEQRYSSRGVTMLTSTIDLYASNEPTPSAGDIKNEFSTSVHPSTIYSGDASIFTVGLQKVQSKDEGVEEPKTRKHSNRLSSQSAAAKLSSRQLMTEYRFGRSHLKQPKIDNMSVSLQTNPSEAIDEFFKCISNTLFTDFFG